ncbi:hypothetical protein HZS_1584 [Henneguya salminicola]|nr:hypothetical protein HZS_1584 [Henneguya salminicola]
MRGLIIMEKIMNKLFSLQNFIDVSKSDKIFYNDVNNFNEQFFLKLNSETLIANNHYTCLYNEFPEKRIFKKRCLDNILFDCAVTNYKSTILSQWMGLNEQKLHDLLRYFRRYSIVIYKKRFSEQIFHPVRSKKLSRINRTVHDLRNVIMGIPCEILSDNFSDEFDSLIYKSNHIGHANNRLIRLFQNDTIIFIYPCNDSQSKLAFSLFLNENITKLDEIEFITPILELGMIEEKDGWCIFVRCAYSFHVYHLIYADGNLTHTNIKSIKHNAHSNYSIFSPIFRNEILLCTNAGLNIIDINEISQTNPQLDKCDKFSSYEWKRGIFTDHPRTVLNITDTKLYLSDLRISNNIDINFKQLIENNQIICPILGGSSLTYFYYLCTNKHIYFIDLRNTNDVLESRKHYLSYEPSLSFTLPTDAINETKLLYISSYTNDENTWVSLLPSKKLMSKAHDIYAPLKICSDIPRDNLSDITGFSIESKSHNRISLFLLRSGGSIYHKTYTIEKYMDGGFTTAKPNDGINRHEIQIQCDVKNCKKLRNSNKRLFNKIKENLLNPVSSANKTNKQKEEILAQGLVEMKYKLRFDKQQNK